MLFLVRATELNPPTRSHRSHFNFQVTHVGYGETWKEKGVFKAYLMKRSHPNYPLPCDTFKRFTSLDSNTSLIWATKASDVDIPYAVIKYRTDEDTCRYRSAHPSKCLRASAQPSPRKNFVTWIWNSLRVVPSARERETGRRIWFEPSRGSCARCCGNRQLRRSVWPSVWLFLSIHESKRYAKPRKNTQGPF